MKALVLAAGKGERLRPLTDTTPKPLLEVGGRLLIHYPLMMLKRGGITRITINVHHLGAMIEASLKDGSDLGLSIRYSREPVLFGTGGPLVALRDYFGGETFVIANSDTILDLDLARMVAYHRKQRALATIALNRPPNLDYYSRLEIDGEGIIRRMRLLRRHGAADFDDYPADLDAKVAASLSGFMYCGVCVCEPAVLAMTPGAPPFSLMAHVFGPMVAKGMRVAGYVHRGYFGTVDDTESYQRLRAEFAKSPLPFAG
ncbi:MAG: NDP-sugar synthase [Candidatus Binatales bacterium]